MAKLINVGFMKRMLLIALLLMIITGGQAQEFHDGHINKADKEGRRQGIWRLYDDEGNLKFTGEYYNGKPVSDFKFYYPNGKTRAVITHQDSGRIAYARNYYTNGRLMATGKYIDQKKDSTWLYYSELDGALSAEEQYKDARKEGTWKTYYPEEGGVAEEYTYVNDIKQGPWIQYFTDGKVKSKGTYIDDLLEGSFIIYHLNGMVEISGFYKNSVKDGIWVYMKETGEMEKREVYREGLLVEQENMGGE